VPVLACLVKVPTLAKRPRLMCHCQSKEKFDRAIELLDPIAQTLNPGVLKAKSLAYLTAICADSGKPNSALGYGAQCEATCKYLMEQLKDKPEQKQVIRTLALGYNNLGYTWQSALGNMDSATEYYEKALALPQDNLPPSFIAHLRNNLAYMYYFQRHLEEAETLNRAAERINLRLGIPYELGVTYYVQGMLCAATNHNEEAIRAFENAIDQFNKAKNERRKGLVYVAYGRLLRQLGWYQETIRLTSVIDGVRPSPSDHGPKLTPEQQISKNARYKKAKEILIEAELIFARAGDWSNRADALNELGCLFRQVEDWDKAIEYLKEGVVSSQQGQNQARELACLLDIAITYYRAGDLLRAKEYAVQVRDITFHEKYDYLFSKAQHTLSVIAFEEQDYDRAFEAAADSCIYVLRRPTKERAIEEALDSMVALITKLPSLELVREKTQYLTGRWKQEGLDKNYPGFILRMNSLVDDYELWAQDSQGHE